MLRLDPGSRRAALVGAVVLVLLALVLSVVFATGCEGADPPDRKAEYAAVAEGLDMTFSEDLPADRAAAIRSLPGFVVRPESRMPRVLANDGASVFEEEGRAKFSNEQDAQEYSFSSFSIKH